MNNYQDIDDGTAVYNEECARAEFESKLKAQPELFARELANGTFDPKSVITLHLKGDYRPHPVKPFDFEEGYAEVVGEFVVSGVLILRWSEFGKALETKFDPIEPAA